MAASITFDHLGEASEIQRGEWPAGRPVGRHPSVTESLPQVLGLLRETGSRAIFYVEALNCELYPGAIGSIPEAGHSVGWHGWFNEPTYAQTPEQFAEAFGQSVAAFRDIGVPLTAARPPGGLLGPHAAGTFSAAGFDYLSLAGDEYGLHGELPLLPYAWRNIDGCYYFPEVSPFGWPSSPEPLGVGAMLRAHRAYIDQTAAAGGCTSFIFHVPWVDRPERFDALRALIRMLSDDERVWFAGSGEIATWMREHPDQVPAVAHHVDAPPAR
jgi:peptidoglycan/xylan/chitin deacetylase (PgdA/CDA1 family)